MTDRPLVFYGGKGGVGKTTLAAAHARLLAQGGARTLLVSTDPAHSTADLLGTPLGNEPVAVEPGLWALEVDAEADADAYVAQVKRDARSAVSPEVLAAVDRHLDLARHSPGTIESALLHRFVDLLGTCPGTYDRLVFDTAPTGHTLRLLTLPALLTGWLEGLVRQRERVAGMDRMLRNLAGNDAPNSDPMVQRLRARRDRLRAARQRLLDDAAFWLVLVPERLPVEETARTAATLTGNGIALGGLVVNRVLPEDTASPFLRERGAQQEQYLREIDERFADHRRVRVAHAARDVTTPADLDVIAHQLALVLQH